MSRRRGFTKDLEAMRQHSFGEETATRMWAEIEKQMASWLDVKVRGTLGTEDGDLQEITILNRTLRITSEGVEYRADKKHQEKDCSMAEEARSKTMR